MATSDSNAKKAGRREHEHEREREPSSLDVAVLIRKESGLSTQNSELRTRFSFSFTPWFRGLALKPQGLPMRCHDWPKHGRNRAKDALWLQSLPLVWPSLLPACLARQQLPYIYTAARPFQFRTLFATSGLVIITNKTHNFFHFPPPLRLHPSPPRQRTDHSALFNTFIDPGELRDQDSVGSECLCAFAIAIRFAFSSVAKESSEVHNSVSITIHNTVPVVVGRDQ
jgi:hypothetical protein